MRIYSRVTSSMVIDLVESKHRGENRIKKLRHLFENRYRISFTPKGVKTLSSGKLTELYKDVRKIK